MLVPPTHLITVSQAMIIASSPECGWNSIFQNTAGIVFLGTPHRGSSSASGPEFNILSSLLQILCCLSPPPFPSFLRANSPKLARIADEFNDVWGSRRIFSFCETKATFRGKIVIQQFNVPSAPFFSPTPILRLSPGETRSQIVQESRYPISEIAITPRYASLTLPEVTFLQRFLMRYSHSFSSSSANSSKSSSASRRSRSRSNDASRRRSSGRRSSDVSSSCRRSSSSSSDNSSRTGNASSRLKIIRDPLARDGRLEAGRLGKNPTPVHFKSFTPRTPALHSIQFFFRMILQMTRVFRTLSSLECSSDRNALALDTMTAPVSPTSCPCVS
jgi:hypothetical protein